MLPLRALALAMVISPYALKNDIKSCEHTCGLRTSLPANSGAAEEDRGRVIVTCAEAEELCLMADENYDKHSPPHGSKEHKHALNHPAATEPLDVMLHVSVNTIRDFRFDEDSFCAEFTVNMSWTDPGLEICNCHSHDEKRKVMIGGLEEHIWVPDIYIWEHISFERGNSLVGENMNMFYVHEVKEGVHVEMTFDITAVIGCSFNTLFYPFDSNICKVQLGSYSYDEEIIDFIMEDNGLKEIGMMYPEQEFLVYVSSLTVEDAEIEYDGVKYWDTGFKFQVVRQQERIIKQYKLPMLVMVMLALGSTLIPTSAEENIRVDRIGILTGTLISSILVFQSAVKVTPSMSSNPLLLFILISLLFILLSFLQYCIISVAWFSVRRKRQIDLVFLVITTLAYVLFGYTMVWRWKQDETTKDEFYDK